MPTTEIYLHVATGEHGLGVVSRPVNGFAARDWLRRTGLLLGFGLVEGYPAGAGVLPRVVVE